jgi:hypothetical protein
MNELKTVLREQSKSEAPRLTVDCFFLLPGGDRFHSQSFPKKEITMVLYRFTHNELLFLGLNLLNSVFIPLGALAMVPTMVL